MGDRGRRRKISTPQYYNEPVVLPKEKARMDSQPTYSNDGDRDRKTPLTIGRTYKMNRMTLLQHLQKILTKYPDDSQILREIIQNAEDAGASVVKICYENRHSQSSGRSEIDKIFASPGLLLYNDALFTEKDFEGISSLNISNKEKEILKVGKFGLGFKSVFHITDNPVIISGDTVLILCPIKSEKNENECWSIDLSDLPKVCKDLEGILNKFEFSKSNLEQGRYNGTLIWLPFRQKTSSISPTVYSDEKVEKLFEEFEKEAFYNVLFLINIDKVQFFKCKTQSPIFQIEVTGDDDFRNERKSFKHKIAVIKNSLPVNDIRSIVEAKIKSPAEEKHFVIVNCLTGTNNLSKKLKPFIRMEKSQYSPYSGMEFCFNSIKSNTPDRGHIFCCQPLPLTTNSMTGLPVQVNGLFDLEENRRHIKLPPANHETMISDWALFWNNGVISELLPQCYFHLLKFLRTRSIKNGNKTQYVNDFYDAFPDPEFVDTSWLLLADKVNQSIHAVAAEDKCHQDYDDKNDDDDDDDDEDDDDDDDSDDIGNDRAYFYTKNGGKNGNWIMYANAVFNCFSTTVSKEVSETVCELLLRAGENIVNLPPNMKNILKYMELSIKKIQPSKVRQILKKSQDELASYSIKRKQDLLEFVITDGKFKELSGLCLLPMNDNSFSPFSSSASTTYIMEDNVAKLFPGMNSSILTKSHVRSKIIWKGITEMADKEMFQLRHLNEEYFPELFTELVRKHWKYNNVNAYFSSEESLFGNRWITDIWELIQKKNFSLKKLRNCPLMPVTYSSTSDTIKFYRLEGNYIFRRNRKGRLSTTIEKVLRILGVLIISEDQVRDFPEYVRDKYIKSPTPDEVVACFKKPNNIEQSIERINTKLSKDGAEELCDYLLMHRTLISEETQAFIRHLCIFPQHDNTNITEFVSLNENDNVLDICRIPKHIPYAKKYIMEKYSLLVRYMGGKIHSEEDCISAMFDKMIREDERYLGEHRTEFAKYLYSIDMSKRIKEKLKQVQFVPSDDKKYHRPDELFNPDSKLLRDLFKGLKGIFPDQDFLSTKRRFTEFLDELGLKHESDVTLDEVYRVVKSVDRNRCLVAANALLKFMKIYPDTFDQNCLAKINGMKWVPCDKKEKWKDLGVNITSKTEICTPEEVICFELNDICGSVNNIISIAELPATVVDFYGWLKPPSLEKVIQHIGNITKTYKIEHCSKYRHILVQIFAYISKCKIENKLIITQLKEIKCVPCKPYGLQYPESVVRKYGHDVNYNLEPYVYEVADEIKEECMPLLGTIGVEKEIGFSHLEQVIKRMSAKYSVKSKMDLKAVKKDRQLLVNILTSISEMNIVEKKLKKILVPISVPDSKGIVFRKINDCTRRSKKGDSFMIAEDYFENKIIYSHPCIDNISEKLGIKSENQRFILSEHCQLLKPWGQKEPLTTRISNLLKDYSDGMAVLKEMVQNAEDAGATKISFMYDERENNDAKYSLLSPGLTECQGQALWVYNDAAFKSKDFENLVQLGCKTKIGNPEKIGKFGLGFCSVYNLTDVPSVLSGDKFGILDPHCYHLGELITNGIPGILLTLSNSLISMKRDQFKPFRNVFGCTFDEHSIKFNGTLFRLPLRTRKQATSKRQEIRKSEYSKKEMIELFSKFREYMADLLLFTENIKEINFYMLDPLAKRPDRDRIFLFNVSADKVHQDENHQNFLQSITKAIRNPEYKFKNNSTMVIKEISVEVSNTARQLFRDTKKGKSTKERCTWLVTCSSGERALMMSRELTDVGGFPLGAVAVPVKRVGSKLERFVKMACLPDGFSHISRMFCFLPIPHPDNTFLPIHINGCFLMDLNRQHIAFSNLDNTIKKKNLSWNEIILQEVVLNAYLKILSDIAGLSKQNIHHSNYWHLWPAGRKKKDELEDLKTQFYKRIVSKNEMVFYRLHKDRVITSTFLDSVFLDPNFRALKPVGDIAYAFAIEFHRAETVIMDLPQTIWQLLKSASQSCSISPLQNIISKIQFFEDYFFPNISRGSLENRNAMLAEAIQDEELHKLLRKNYCIPVKNSNRLRKPCELISEKEYLSSMFDDTDERFLASDFERFDNVLIKLGMMTNTMPSNLLLDRMESVHATKQKKIRSIAILWYLQINYNKHDDVIHNIRKIPFLTIMLKPKSWNLRWKATKADRHLILSPETVYSPHDKNLVGCVALVADIDEDISEETLFKIGIKQVEEMCLLEQISFIGDLNLKFSRGIENVMDDLYKALSNQLQKQGLKQNTQIKALKNKTILKVKKRMVKPLNVAYNIKYKPCKPYLYQLETTHDLRPLWDALEIQDIFPKERLLQVLSDIYEKEGNNSVSEIRVRSIVNILANLSQYKYSLTDEEKAFIKIPDNTCQLFHINEICYGESDDNEFVYDDDEFRMIHKDITANIIESLGIMSKRILYLRKSSDEIPFGQHEKLVVRLKNLLKDCPKDYSVLNELLQNADDASATEVHFVLDLRQHKAEQIFSKKWKPLQGPALCIFNNAHFTEDDMKGIQNLGEGNKTGDATKTGQFGVGFNAVYHITDAPSFLTRWINANGQEDGACCVFDPLFRYLDIVQPNSPGRRFPLSKLQSKYLDNFNCYLQDLLCSPVGTWFRLPLRMKSDGESEISTTAVSLNEMKALMTSMKTKLKTSLLFLRNVKKISISFVEEGHSRLSNTYFAEASISNEDSVNVKQFMARLSEIPKRFQSRVCINGINEVAYTMQIHDNFESYENWCIVQTFGFSDANKIPFEVKDALEHGLKVLPLGGTAIKCSSNERNDLLEVQGQAFCFLPLPIFTGLPCHINGHFCVYSNRNELFWGKCKTAVPYLWNKLLLQQTVAHSYATCLDLFRKSIPLSVSPETLKCLKHFFETFPRFQNITADVWKELALSVFTDIQRRELELFPVCPYFNEHDAWNSSTMVMHGKTMRWVAINSNEYEWQPCFDCLGLDSEDNIGSNKSFDSKCNGPFGSTTDSTKDNEDNQEYRKINVQLLRVTLVDLGLKLICTPRAIYSTIDELASFQERNKIELYISGKLNVLKVNPYIVTQFLSSWKSNYEDKCKISEVDIPLNETVFETLDRFSNILKYCFTSTKCDTFSFVVDNAQRLQPLPSTIILSEYCSLLPGSNERFVNEELVDIFNTKSSHLFGTLDLYTFCTLLCDSINKKKCGAGSPNNMMNSQHKLPNQQWLNTFWNFLNTFDTLDQKLDMWCFVPSKISKNKFRLFPFQLAYAIIDASSFSRTNVGSSTISDVINRLAFPTLSSITKCSKHITKLVASREEPLNFAKFLVYHCDIINEESMSSQECGDIVSFLNKAVHTFDQDLLQKLWTLRIFVSIEDNIVSLEGCERVVVLKMENTSMVTKGLQFWAKETKTALIKHNAYHEDIYKCLNFCLCYGERDEHCLLEFYMTYLLPDFSKVPKTATLSHLEFVRDRLITGNSKRLKNKLPLLKLFYRNPSASTLEMANKFYNPHNVVFKSLCQQCDFPPNPFDKEDWKDFMLIAGIQNNVTEILFKQFALIIENQGFCGESSSQSKILVHHLFNQVELQKIPFLTEISKIRFLFPYQCPQNYTHICPQYKANSLIAFRGALHCNSESLAWTVMQILPKYAIHNCHISKHLQTIKEPCLHMFVEHLENVCSSLVVSTGKPNDVEWIESLMVKLYTHLKKHFQDIPPDLMKRIQKIPLVHVKRHELFITAKQVVLKVSFEKEIYPYLLVGSEEYGKFHPVFRQLGASDDLVLNHYFRVMSCVKAETGNNTLSHDELAVTEKAMYGMLELLKRHTIEDQVNVEEPVLFLPSRDGILMKSSDLIYGDDTFLEKRLLNQKCVVFLRSVTCFLKNGFDVQKCFKLLPVCYQPQFLSKAVVEKIVNSTTVTQWRVAKQIEQIVTSDLFIHCMIRLAKSETTTEKLSDAVLTKIKTHLKTFRVISLSNVFTVLEYRDREIENSGVEKSVFYSTKDKSLYVEYSNLDLQLWMVKNHNILAKIVNKLCCYKASLENIQTVLISFQFSNKEMNDLLESLGAVPIDYVPVYESWTPLPGAIVPHELLQFLVQDMINFEVGNAAVYEIVDNRFEEDGSNRDVIYIYVKIVKICESGTLTKYEIDLGEIETKIVLSDRLFKIVRKRTPQNECEAEGGCLAKANIPIGTAQETPSTAKSFEEIIEDIEETLLAAWREGRDTFKRVFRRLILHWHPDKNGNSDESNEISKHIINFAKDIKSGKIDINNVPSRKEREEKRKKSRGKYRYWWESDSKNPKRNNGSSNKYGKEWSFDPNSFAENVRREYTRRRSNFNEYGRTHNADPQPEMANIWFKQARNDLKAAENLVKSLESFNWVCVMCHQAAEKAIKALQTKIDASQLKMNHSLLTPLTMSNETLRINAEQLERLVGDYTRMRYPRPSEYPRAPSDLYTESMARDTIRLARVIIEAVQGLL